MGTQFFWFYDVLLVAIFIAIVYKCTRRGFAAGVVSLVGNLLAFVIAFGVCAPASSYIYDNFVAPGVIEKINYTAPKSASGNGAVDEAFATLRNADMSKATVSGKAIAELQLELIPDSSGKVTIDLSDVDLSQTGISDGNLAFFGIDSNFTLSPRNLGKVDIIASEYTKYDLEDIILSRAVSNRIAEKANSNHESLDKILSDTIPGFSQVSQGSTDLVSILILNIISNGSDSLEESINENLVRPVLIVPFKALIFAIIFALISFVVSFIAKSMQLVNNIPLFGKINSFLGLILGIVQAIIIIAIVCIGISIIITLTADNIIFLNTMTIDETHIFKHVYNIKFLNF